MFFTPEGFITYRGHAAMQNQLAFPLLKAFFDQESFAHVVEVGTAHGGTTLFLADQARQRGFRFVSYDDWPAARTPDLDATGALITRDCFDEVSVAEITAMIADGRTLILCDGGDKVREFLTFAPLLKPGDAIMAHDYAPDRATFEAQIQGQYWNWLEITDADVQPVLPLLSRYDQVPLWKAAWLACIRI